jgi:hypothetical protein
VNSSLNPFPAKAAADGRHTCVANGLAAPPSASLPPSSHYWRSRGAPNLRQGHKAHRARPAQPAPPVPSVRLDLKAPKARKDPLAPRAPPVSVAKSARPAPRVRSARKVHKVRPVHKGLQVLPANAAKLDRKAQQARPVQPDHPARRGTPAQRHQSGSSPVRITCAAPMTSSWSRWSAPAARPMVRNAPRPARKLPYSVRASDSPVFEPN